MKFSIIIPVYNSEKYLRKCLDSVLNQTYKNYEILIVNDGSTDDSQKIIDGYAAKIDKIKYFVQKNNGQSSARNLALNNINGDYIIFLDSDDYLELELLEKLNSYLSLYPKIDVLRFQANLVDESYKIIDKVQFHEFNNKSGEEAFDIFVEENIFDTPCLYTYKFDYWKKNDFKFSIGYVHEDFGLIPRVILEAKFISSIGFFGYNYLQNPSSTTHSYDRDKVLKRVYDMLYHYDNLYSFIINYHEKSPKVKRKFISFLANSIILKSRELSSQDLDKYILELKKRKVSKQLIADTFPRLIKKILITINLKLYIKIFIRK